ncbi:hypothetical protein HDU67_000576, partial [Dinochytrium kinnereticum]
SDVPVYGTATYVPSPPSYSSDVPVYGTATSVPSPPSYSSVDQGYGTATSVPSSASQAPVPSGSPTPTRIINYKSYATAGGICYESEEQGYRHPVFCIPEQSNSLRNSPYAVEPFGPTTVARYVALMVVFGWPMVTMRLAIKTILFSAISDTQHNTHPVLFALKMKSVKALVALLVAASAVSALPIAQSFDGSSEPVKTTPTSGDPTPTPTPSPSPTSTIKYKSFTTPGAICYEPEEPAPPGQAHAVFCVPDATAVPGTPTYTPTPTISPSPTSSINSIKYKSFTTPGAICYEPEEPAPPGQAHAVFCVPDATAVPGTPTYTPTPTISPSPTSSIKYKSFTTPGAICYEPEEPAPPGQAHAVFCVPDATAVPGTPTYTPTPTMSPSPTSSIKYKSFTTPGAICYEPEEPAPPGQAHAVFCIPDATAVPGTPTYTPTEVSATAAVTVTVTEGGHEVPTSAYV